MFTRTHELKVALEDFTLRCRPNTCGLCRHVMPLSNCESYTVLGWVDVYCVRAAFLGRRWHIQYIYPRILLYVHTYTSRWPSREGQPANGSILYKSCGDQVIDGLTTDRVDRASAPIN